MRARPRPAVACVLDLCVYRLEGGHLALIAKNYLRPDGASWHNQLARDGKPLTPTTPARVLYHLFLAVAEADRLIGLTAPPKPSGNS